jgi:Family of unknown function (DUF6267)
MYHEFSRFLTESDKVRMKAEMPSVHLVHLEDPVLDGGHGGVHAAANFLDDAHAFLSGKKAVNNYYYKYDGAPSVLFGLHPEGGKFFVATKSAFNTNPPINHKKNDVVNNHGYSKSLSKQLMASLTHLPKIMPKDAKPGDIYQGDIMHAGSVKAEAGLHHFQPNMIRYSAPKDSAHGREAKNAKLGIVVHTQYEGGMPKLIDKKSHGRLQKHPDVHSISPMVEPSLKHYSPDEMKEFLKHRDAATKLYRSMKPEDMDAMMMHSGDMQRYLHHHLQRGVVPSSEEYINFIGDNHSKRSEKIKTDKAMKFRNRVESGKMAHAYQHGETIDKVLKLHGHIQKAKNVLVGVMSKSNPWSHTVNGHPTGPEGIVSVAPDGTAVKFVDKGEFAKHNYNKQEKNK